MWFSAKRHLMEFGPDLMEFGPFLKELPLKPLISCSIRAFLCKIRAISHVYSVHFGKVFRRPLWGLFYRGQQYHHQIIYFHHSLFLNQHTSHAFWIKSLTAAKLPIYRGQQQYIQQISERSEHISAINPENHYYFSFASFLFAAGHLGLGFQGPQQPLGR